MFPNSFGSQVSPDWTSLEVKSAWSDEATYHHSLSHGSQAPCQGLMLRILSQTEGPLVLCPPPHMLNGEASAASKPPAQACCSSWSNRLGQEGVQRMTLLCRSKGTCVRGPSSPTLTGLGQPCGWPSLQPNSPGAPVDSHAKFHYDISWHFSHSRWEKGQWKKRLVTSRNSFHFIINLKEGMVSQKKKKNQSYPAKNLLKRDFLNLLPGRWIELVIAVFFSLHYWVVLSWVCAFLSWCLKAKILILFLSECFL